ncbi:MAG TPA: asparagine synthase (glutamine-hydrolyzing) [Candidatus Handelsmanbacteria bacterium]|nr:asparagine synthase (glutamine-hydrolyzing) [Candidatus Handelsmanbacteria bacterium]
MCGIAGKVHADHERPVSEDLVRRMCAAMVYRGPDDEGVHLDTPAGIGMRRLKVIDLEGGHQPMTNEDGSLWIVFNGEIYNYRQLRQELEQQGHTFTTASDTEVLLHLFEDEDVDSFRRLQGMFSIALWDTRNKRLVLARDRLGKKPLFYALSDDALTFGSELNVVLEDETIPTQVDEGAVDMYLSFLFVPQPHTALRSVRKLPAGGYAVYQDGQMKVASYWSVPEIRPQDRALPIAQLEEEVDALLAEAVRDRLIADVPLGAFLSGGLDSSLITAYMCREAGQVRTFAIGFEEGSFNELGFARQAAEALGTCHEEHIVNYDVRDLMPELLDHFGEPFADSSAVPLFHLSRMTRRSVTVALSGDGGDEVFGGYRRYTAWLWAQKYQRWTPALARRAIDSLATGLREPSVYYGHSLRKRLRRFLEFSAALEQDPSSSWAFFLLEGEKQALYTEEFAATLDGGRHPRAPAPAATDLMQIDQGTYLPDDILAKVDRASMACSLEVRSPLLDHRLVEYMAGVPRHWKVTLRERKILLRRIARKYLPAHIIDRPKQGFSIPLNAWLQGPLRDWMEELLSVHSLQQRGWFRPQTVRRVVDDHLQGRRDFSQQLWALMMLELWLRRRVSR